MSEQIVKVKARNVSLYPRDWQAVHEVAEKSGVKSVSAALRIIIQEWRKAQMQQALNS
ncbi:MAG: hypothetical protein JXA33_10850 [Anaerolineae bacterium]|nr:hypothetical protein [Anaerolineae bacterium]